MAKMSNDGIYKPQKTLSKQDSWLVTDSKNSKKTKTVYLEDLIGYIGADIEGYYDELNYVENIADDLSGVILSNNFLLVKTLNATYYFVSKKTSIETFENSRIYINKPGIFINFGNPDISNESLKAWIVEIDETIALEDDKYFFNFWIKDTILSGGYKGTAQEIVDEINALSGGDQVSKVISGGMVWVSGLTYKSINLKYKILGQLFVIPDGTELTSNIGDDTYDRKDLFYGDDLGALGTSEGVPSVNPQANTLPFYRLQLSVIDIAANATEPSNVSKKAVYVENAGQPNEANVTESTEGIRINIADETTPISETKSIKTLSGLNDADTIDLSLSTPVSISDFSSLEYDIKLLEAWGNDYIAFGLYNGAAFVGFINVTSSFLDTSNITDVQTVTLFKDSFTYSSNPMEFDTIKIISRVRGTSTMQFVLDNIYINIDPNTKQPTKILGTNVELDTTDFDKNLDNTITTVQKLAQAYNNSDIFPIIYILGRPWELRKTVNQFDLTKRTILESNDVIVGSRGPGEYEFLRYDGGDQTDFDNSYTVIAGI